MEIKGINLLPVVGPEKTKQTKDNVQSFSAYLKEALNKVNASQLEAEYLIHDFVIGNDVDYIRLF